jgi:type II secretory pathway pseudopilin PulG
MAIIAGLAALLVFTGLRWNMSKAENEQLRQQIASLKRQLKNR